MEVSKIIRSGCFSKIILFIIVIVALIFLFINSSFFLKIIYPLPYLEIVEEEGEKYQVDPYLIMAIMRVESKFNPNAQSSRGALGLMQVLPDTAEWIARELRYENFDKELLLIPEHNIRFGTWYFNYLCKQFGGNSIAAIAAYNGGETNVKKWIKNNVWSGRYSDLDNIPFKETREYVYKIIIDYKTYQDLYKN